MDSDETLAVDTRGEALSCTSLASLFIVQLQLVQRRAHLTSTLSPPSPHKVRLRRGANSLPGCYSRA